MMALQLREMEPAEARAQGRWNMPAALQKIVQRLRPLEGEGPEVRQQRNYLNGLLKRDQSRSLAWQKTLYRLNGGKRGYVDEIRRINSAFPKMNKDCKLSVVIAAANEEQNIVRTLEGWTTKQHLANPKDYELVVLVNKPNANAKWDQTAERVREFQRRNPQYNIRLVAKAFNFPEKDIGLNGQRIAKGVHMGLIFKLASDLSVLRNLNRDSPHKAGHMIITSGGDVVARHPKFVRWLLAQGKKEPAADFIKVGYGLAPSVSRRVPLYWAFHTYRNAFTDQYHGVRPRRHGAFRAAAYAGIGGFDPERNVAEEVDFGKRLAEAHGRIQPVEFTGVLDNPRRSLHALFSKKPVVGEYRGFDADEELKKMGEGHVANVPPSALLNVANLSREVTAHFNAYMKRMKESGAAGWYTRSRRMLDASLHQIGLAPSDYRVQVQRDARGRIGAASVEVLDTKKVWQQHKEALRSDTHAWVRQAPMF